jgi:hypothetical protein
MIKQFIKDWFPKTPEFDNIARFIIESGVEIVPEQGLGWLPGYTNISVCRKPHHVDPYIRFMEENMFMLHDVIHQIWTMNISKGVTEYEYVVRQLHGELMTFYLVEYIIPKSWYDNHSKYIDDVRDSYWMMYEILQQRPDNTNVIDWMYSIFINGREIDIPEFNRGALEKYRKMFKQDKINSMQNYRLLGDFYQQPDYCICGISGQNHVDFFTAVSSGAVRNIKRDFSLVLPNNWI